LALNVERRKSCKWNIMKSLQQCVTLATSVTECYFHFVMMFLPVEVFWVVMPCSAMVGYQCLRGPCCLHFHPEDGGSKVHGILPQQWMTS
jgi:hypothetical protein